MDFAEYERVVALAHQLEENLPPGVWSVGVGLREKAGHLENEICLVFLTHRKRAVGQLTDGEVIPSSIDGIPTDVREMTPSPHASPYEKIDPLLGGVSMTVEGKAGFSGTLGGIFRTRQDRRLVAITNRHVVRLNAFGWLRGQRGRIEAYQPTVSAANQFGSVLQESKWPDCASVVINEQLRGARPRLRATDGRPELELAAIGVPRVNDEVFKVGARTGFTEARVTYVSRVDVALNPRVGRTDPISDHGDSGSLWCRQDAEGVVAVALHWGGSSGVASAHQMVAVQKALDIECVPLG